MEKILKAQKYNLLIVAGIFIAAILVLVAFLFVYYTSPANALDGSAGQPAHSHDGWPCLNCGSYNSSYIKHLQAELNWLHNNLVGFSIGSKYPLAVDGAWGSNTENAVKDFQSFVDILVDGMVGNQTWTYMEFWVMTAPDISADASAHPSGVTIKYPIYGTCRAITNNNSSSIATPLGTRAEWDAYRANAPNLSDVVGDCDITSGSGSSDGGGGDEAGGGGSTVTYGTAYRCKCTYGPSTAYRCGAPAPGGSCSQNWDGTMCVDGVGTWEVVCSSSCNNSGC